MLKPLRYKASQCVSTQRPNHLCNSMVRLICINNSSANKSTSTMFKRWEANRGNMAYLPLSGSKLTRNVGSSFWNRFRAFENYQPTKIWDNNVSFSSQDGHGNGSRYLGAPRWIKHVLLCILASLSACETISIDERMNRPEDQHLSKQGQLQVTSLAPEHSLTSWCI